jgi:hypothetical protein
MTPPQVQKLTDPEDEEIGPKLVFYRAAGEGIRYSDHVVNLLNAESVQAGRLTGGNPITHDQWWIPLAALAAAGAPYAKALASVTQTWLKERKGRQVRLENATSRVTANTAADAERLLVALTKHEKEPEGLQVTKARKSPARKAPAKRTKKR